MSDEVEDGSTDNTSDAVDCLERTQVYSFCFQILFLFSSDHAMLKIATDYLSVQISSERRVLARSVWFEYHDAGGEIIVWGEGWGFTAKY